MPAANYTNTHHTSTHLWLLGLGLKAGVRECHAVAVAEEADEGAKGHGLHAVVDVADPVAGQRPGASGPFHVGEADSGFVGQRTQDGLG